MSEFSDLLSRFELTESQCAALERHRDLLIRWNQRMNLTSVADLEELVLFHYGESLFLADQLPAGVLVIADIGSGAGFPGVPLAVRRPDCSVTLVESNSRKAVFLREATRGLLNVRVLDSRAEAVGGHYDWVVSRAVSWEALSTVVAQLCDHVALLVSDSDTEQIRQDPRVVWRDCERIPWGNRRVVLTGDVSRGT